jgi:hypothetical protein
MGLLKEVDIHQDEEVVKSPRRIVRRLGVGGGRTFFDIPGEKAYPKN